MMVLVVEEMSRLLIFERIMRESMPLIYLLSHDHDVMIESPTIDGEIDRHHFVRTIDIILHAVSASMMYAKAKGVVGTFVQ